MGGKRLELFGVVVWWEEFAMRMQVQEAVYMLVSPRQTLQKLRTLILKSVSYRVGTTVGLHYYVK